MNMNLVTPQESPRHQDDLFTTPTPGNTTLPLGFFNFNISDRHIKLCPLEVLMLANDPSTPKEVVEDLFTDLHEDHNLATNIDLLYEVLLLAHTHTPGWSALPFETFVAYVDVQPLTGGLTNLLFCLEIHPEMYNKENDDVANEIAKKRLPTMKQLLKNLEQHTKIADLDASLIPTAHATTIKCVCRIYGDASFANRTTELQYAELAQAAGITDVVYCSWRHGRITSYLDGSSFMDYAADNYWLNPVVQSSVAYYQGILHAAPVAHPIPSEPLLQTTLRKCYKDSMKIKLQKKVEEYLAANNNKRRISSVFDMFNDNADNQLYALKRPPNQKRQNEYSRLEDIVLPLPPQLAHVLVPLFNAPQIANGEADLVQTQNSDLLVQKYNLINNDAKNNQIVNDNICPKIRELTPAEQELAIEYLDLPRVADEIRWLMSLCKNFPMTNSHNDFHSGNVMLLKQVSKEASSFIQEYNKEDGTAAAPNEYIPYKSNDLPLPFPSRFLDYIKVIDWEFAGVTVRGFDPANSLTECQIVYEGDYPGFTLDIPASISSHLIGQYKNIELSTTIVEERVQNFKQLEHPEMTTWLKENCDETLIKRILTTQSQPEDEKVGATIQALCLPDSIVNTSMKEQLLAEDHKPAFRPREYFWAKSHLIGFYHSLKDQQAKQGKYDEPIRPFCNQPDYILPDNIEVFLEEQIPKLLYESMICSFGTAFVWLFWSVICHEKSQIGGFGFLEHGLARMVAYVAKKNAMIKMGLIQPNYQGNKKTE